MSNYLLNTLSPLLFNKGGRIFCSEFVEVETWRERHELPSGAGARDRRCTLVPVSPVQPPARCYSKAPAQRIQGYIRGYIGGGESETEAHPAGVRCIYGVTWDYMCGGREGEREGERGREREKHSQTSSNPLDSTAYQSIDTTRKYYPPEKIIGVRWIH